MSFMQGYSRLSINCGKNDYCYWKIIYVIKCDKLINRLVKYWARRFVNVRSAWGRLHLFKDTAVRTWCSLHTVEELEVPVARLLALSGETSAFNAAIFIE
ncbi:hypothetical protein FGO68_gene12439 [Halteria grandinella]|uniref:Uncharacterized protein n=1 Tax=Halteria grandinella TaxID=5974 RepID=A0A8J8NPV7_HALGN|nr:hypothetical protein FGO68_gene12439 [Halteria grandinella]